MMNAKRMIAAAILVLAAADDAAAGPYVTAGVELASADFSLEAPFNGRIEDDATMYAVGLGYRFSDFLAAEIGTAWNGEFTGLGNPCPAGGTCLLPLRRIPGNDISVYSATLVPGIDCGDVRFFVEAGLYRAEVDTTIALANDDFSRDGWLLGAGARWRFSDAWSVSVDASVLDDTMDRVGIAVGWHP